METYMWIIWLSIFIITLVVEAITFDLVSIWFSGSALLTLGLSFVPGLPFWGEIIIFVLVGVLLCVLTRPFIKKFLKGKKEQGKTNLDSLIGKEYKLIKTIEKYSVGEVKINGVLWDCESKNGDIIAKNQTVKIVAINGNKLIVEEVK